MKVNKRRTAPALLVRPQRANTAANKSVTTTSIRRENVALLLSLIKEYGPISRIDLARRSGLTKAAVTKIINPLLQAQLVKEVGNVETERGRKPILLAFDRANYFALSMVVLRQGILIGLADLSGKILLEREIEITNNPPQDELVNQLVALVEEILRITDTLPSQILGLGIACPGPLDTRQGIILAPPHFHGWHDLPLQSLLEERLGFPVYLDNNANVAALGEKWFGIAKGLQNFVYLDLHEGIGSGIILDGEIYQGADGIAGEIGHTSITFDGPRCECGNCGCLELYAGPQAIIDRVHAALRSGAPSSLGPLLTTGAPLTLKVIIAAAQAGDQVARAALDTAADYLSLGLANFLNLFNLKEILIGGELGQAGPVFLAPLQKKLIARLWPVTARNLNLRPAVLGKRAYLLGAAALALSFVFKSLEYPQHDSWPKSG